MYHLRNARGLTLIELTLTLALISVIASLVTTSWTGIIASTRHINLVNNTHRLFSAARFHAVHQKTLTTICPLSRHLRCIDRWNQPISIFADKNNDKRPDNSRIFKTISLSSPDSVLVSRTAGRGYFQFSADGMSHGTMGSLIACSGGDKQTKMSYLALNLGGRLRTLHDKDHNGEMILPWGTKISCPSTP